MTAYHIEWSCCAVQQSRKADVRFGSKADVTLLNFDVRFTPKSGHGRAALGCPLCANSRPEQVQRTEHVLLDHLIGDAEQRRRYCEAKYPRGLGVDDQLEFVRLQYR
jgi:hypothetical protein